MVSRSFLPGALALYRSLEKHCVDLSFTALVIDIHPAEARKLSVKLPFQILTPEALDAPGLRRLWKYYSVFELCNVLRPFLIRHLLKKKKPNQVIYLDSDIYVTGRFDYIEKKLNQYVYAFTPHTLKPYPLDSFVPNDLSLLHYGIYNSGFQAYRNHPQSFKVLEWLMPRLMLYGFNDPPRYYVDQKFLPLAAASFPEGFFCVDHPGYNIAYWNLHERKIEIKAGRYFTQGSPAVFFHFSGYDLRRPGEWTQRGRKKDPSQPSGTSGISLRKPAKHAVPTLGKVLAEYRELLKGCCEELKGEKKAELKKQTRNRNRARFFKEEYPKLLKQINLLKR